METSVDSVFSSIPPRTALLVAACFLLALGLGALALLPLARAAVRRLLPAREAPVAGWGFAHVVLAALVVLALLALSGLLVPRPQEAAADLLLVDGLTRMACAL